MLIVTAPSCASLVTFVRNHLRKDGFVVPVIDAGKTHSTISEDSYDNVDATRAKHMEQFVDSILPTRRTLADGEDDGLDL